MPTNIHLSASPLSGERPKIPSLGLGTWNLGGHRFDRDETKRGAGLAIMRAALAIGYRLFDTAEVYSGGMAEEVIGESIQGYPRQELFIISKVWKEHLRPADVRQAIEGSLRRLRTDYVDLYLIHWPGESIPFSETIPAMEQLVREGLTRTIGVSNFSVEQMAQAQKHLSEAKFTANQIEYNLLHRDPERDVIPYCRQHGMDVIAYRPLAKGAFLRKHYKILEELAGKYKKTPAQIALNWLLSQEVIAIPQASSREHLLDNWGAQGWKMNDEDIELLRTFQ